MRRFFRAQRSHSRTPMRPARDLGGGGERVERDAAGRATRPGSARIHQSRLTHRFHLM
jgi:hypothetical protein